MIRADKAWMVILLSCLMSFSAFAADTERDAPTPGTGVEFLKTTAGKLVFVPSASNLEGLGLKMEVVSQTDVVDEAPGLTTVFAALEAPGIEIITHDGHFRAFSGGQVQTLGELAFSKDGVKVSVGDFRIEQSMGDNGSRWVATDTIHGIGETFNLMPSGMVNLDPRGGSLEWAGLEVYLTGDAAKKLGVPAEGSEPIGVMFLQSDVQYIDELSSFDHPAIEEGERSSRGGIGPDVIVGDIYDIRKWGTIGTRSSYSLGTESCNMGDALLEWFANNNRHPVIGQSIFRIKECKFEQLGMGWLKHGFCALSLFLCGSCQSGTGCDHLGILCSDPYSAFLNGDQGGLGPRSEVNATTGVFPYPPGGPPASGSLSRRIILNHSDIQPSQNPGAIYIAEAQYITQDDAQAGNGNNNNSWRRVSFNSANNMSFVGSTQREESAIQAWPDFDPTATVLSADVAGDGRFWIGYTVKDNQDGTWTYNYVMYNQNSHNCARTFNVPVDASVTLTDVYFGDVEYDAEPYSGTDWTFSRSATKASWSTETFAQNANANALRWSTAYNFGFTANTPPQNALADADQFRTPAVNFKFEVQAPQASTDDFTLSVDLTSNDTSIPRGERLFATANLTTQPQLPDTLVRFELRAFEPGGGEYVGSPMISKDKTIGGGLDKDRQVRFLVPGDADLGGWTLRLTAERLSDGITREIELPFTVTN